MGFNLHIEGSGSTVGDGAADSASESEAVLRKWLVGSRIDGIYGIYGIWLDMWKRGRNEPRVKVEALGRISSGSSHCVDVEGIGWLRGDSKTWRRKRKGEKDLKAGMGPEGWARANPEPSAQHGLCPPSPGQRDSSTVYYSSILVL